MNSEVEITSKIYRIKPVNRNWMIKVDPDSNIKDPMAFVFGKTHSEVRAEFNMKTRMYNTGLTKEEAKQLEKALLLKDDTLNPLNTEFWAKHKIVIPYSGKTLDVSNPQDLLDVKLLLVNSKVANGKDDINLIHAEYLIENKEEESRAYNKKFEIKEKAFIALTKMSTTDLINFLKVWENGKTKVTHGHTPDQIKSIVGKIVDEKSQKFLDTINQKHYKDIIFIYDAIDIGAMQVASGKYYVTGEPDTLGDLEETIAHLKDPRNNTRKLSLTAKLEAVKNKVV